MPAHALDDGFTSVAPAASSVIPLPSPASHHQAITLITRALQGLDALSAVETVPLVVEEATVVEEADPEDDADPPTLPSRQQLLQLRATCYKKVGDLASAAKVRGA